LLIVAVSLATALAISLTMASFAEKWLKEALHQHASSVSQSLARSVLIQVSHDDFWEAFEAIRAVVSVEGGPQYCHVVVLDRHRKVFVSSDPARFAIGSSTSTLSGPLDRADKLPRSARPVVVDTRSDGEWFAVVNMPLASTDGELIGNLLMSFSHRASAVRVGEAVSTVALITVGIAAVLCPLGWWLGHRVASPVTRATDVLYRMAEDAAAKSSPRASSTRNATPLPLQPTSELDRLEHSVAALQLQLREKEQLQESFRALTELSAVGIGSADASGMMTYVNERGAVIVGLPADQCQGEGWMRTLHPEDRDRIAIAWHEATASGALYRGEFRFRHPGGRTVHVIGELRPMAGDGAPLVAYVVTWVDVTAMKEIEQHQLARAAAEQANEAKSEFLAHMSHELRTPLNAIMGYAQILQRDRYLGERQQRGVRIIHDSGQHLLTLIEEILDLARIEAGKVDIAPAVLKLPHFLRFITEVIRVKAEQKSLAFTCETPADLPSAVMVDEVRLRQVLLNLLGNAVKFTEHGQVALRVSSLGRSVDSIAVRFAVEDSGIGIAPEEIERIFLPFEQGGQQANRLGGAGLGLAISRQLVRLMDGELQVKSRSGTGSLFWFDLRLDIAQECVRPAPSQPACITGYRGPRKKVLIVDDVVHNRAVAVAMLTSLGFETVEARDGSEALTKALAESPDLVLMDGMMPVLDGLAATQHLRQATATCALPIIVMSASASETDKHQALACGANAFVAKPLVFDHLVAEVGALLSVTWTLERDERKAPEAPVIDTHQPPGASPAASPGLPTRPSSA